VVPFPNGLPTDVTYDLEILLSRLNPHGSASLEGEIDVGMAAVYVKDFVRTVSLRKYLANEQDFSIPVELTILGGFKESEDRHVKLNMTHIRLVKVGQSKDARLTLHKPAESPRPPPSRC
jgi:hypothetical protein